MSHSTVLHTIPLYQDYPNLFKTEASVMEVSELDLKKKHYYCLRLDQTIFHPQGGGQLSDQGTIQGHTVEFVHKVMLEKTNDAFAIFHCFSNPLEISTGERVSLSVNVENRLLNSRWHTAAHVLGHLIEDSFPIFRPFGGECFPNAAHMKFMKITDGEFPSMEEVSQKISIAYKKLLEKDPPFSIVQNNSFRGLKIGDYEPVGCGGTHVENLAQLGILFVERIKANAKTNTLSVFYKLT